MTEKNNKWARYKHNKQMTDKTTSAQDRNNEK